MTDEELKTKSNKTSKEISERIVDEVNILDISIDYKMSLMANIAGGIYTNILFGLKKQFNDDIFEQALEIGNRIFKEAKENHKKQRSANAN